MQNLFHNILLPEINADYVFLDLPYHSNIGDSLIWKGAEDFLKSLPYKCLLRTSFQTFTFPELKKETIVLLHGGGNWGDLYAPHNELRRNVVKRYPDNKIIILPQTVYYDGIRNARNDAKIFRQHKHLTICARDKYSYRFLKAFGFCENIFLMPDMAFHINVEELKQYYKLPLHKDLIFQRVDKEKTNMNVVNALTDSYDVSDWPDYEKTEPQVEYLYELIKEGNYKDADEYAVNTYLPARVGTGVEMISQYDKVFSNRLHGAILSILLGKEVYIFDNSYGKNSQYYDTWLRGFNNVHLLSRSRNFNVVRKCKFFIFWMLSIVDRIIE